ncbi:Ig-like domain-containing protein [Pontibacter ramchanderi]|uniref:Polysaccharide lyase family 4-like protein n=1 Tax=Pontibacter ramchanderi TaxID=1179743 RepID=A0A2N3UCY1_9BACT|nr:Ig-like domain-containing protein [Pontibacter ramchanderi]PKV67223.1 polysaccharide lyase family 4-like protein [Pontibacter ramchanderi]
MKIVNSIFIATTLSALASCASINNPEGGPKDEEAPKLLNSNPKPKELNVSTRTITLDFDEEVQPNNLQKELLITPFTENKYQVRMSKTRLELVFEEPFEANTTYTLNFRKGIQDITEKNIAEGLGLTFSTGSFIDSSRVSGQVVRLQTQQPEKEAVVALYPTNDTLSIRKSRPYYQTQANANGEFTFENIKDGEYRIYALTDKNNNSLYDSEDEWIAYKAEPIRVTSAKQDVVLQTVRIDTKRPILQRRERYTDRFIANYGEGIERFYAIPAGMPKDTLVHKISADGKIIDIFGNNRFTGGSAVLTALDSAANRTVDTVQIAFEGKRAQRVNGARLKASGSNGNNTIAIGQQVTIELETPVRIQTKEPIRLLADSIEVARLTYPDQVRLDRSATEISFTMPKWTGTAREATIILDSAGIVPVQGDQFSKPPIQLTIAEARGAGSLRGGVKTQQTNYIIQLVDNEYKVKNQVRNAKTFNFRNIEPGTYYIRVILDANNNGKWDGGDPELIKEPEQVYLHDKPLEIRANWDMEENIAF